MKKNKLLISMLFSSLVLLPSCNTSKNTSIIDDGGKEEMPSTPYNFSSDVVSQKDGFEVYRASDGYLSKREQGYNHFYYEEKTETGYSKLDLVDGEFASKSVSFKNDLVTTTENVNATRLFVSPISGNAIIKNSLFIEEGSSLVIEIYKNDSLLITETVHNESKYFDLNVDLVKDDELRFVLKGDAKVKFNPYIDFVKAPEQKLVTACDGFYGDVHPFYDPVTKKMYMFYLSTGNQSVDKKQTFCSLLTSSSNMFVYQDDLCQMDDNKRPEQDLYFVLNVFKDKEGRYRSSQGGNLKVCSSISEDLHTWKAGSEPYMDDLGNLFWTYSAPAAKGVYSSRDPDTFYDPETDKYYTVVLSYYTPNAANGEKHLNLYIGDNKGHYSDETKKLINFTNKGDSECPQIKKIGNRWYIFYSVYGTGAKGNVGRLSYRVGPENTLPQDVDWNSCQEKYINGIDLHAAQVCEVLGKYYVYGWIHYAFNENVWGGYLNIPQEVYVKENGDLGSRFDAELVSYLDKGLIAKFDDPISNQTTIGNVYRNLIKAIWIYEKYEPRI